MRTVEGKLNLLISLPSLLTAVECGRLSAAVNGWMNPLAGDGTFAYPERRFFGCVEGYYNFPAGAISIRQCKADESWSGSAPVCQRKCGRKLSHLFSEFKLDFLP